jgi:CheY-like chemotaxis protein
MSEQQQSHVRRQVAASFAALAEAATPASMTGGGEGGPPSVAISLVQGGEAATPAASPVATPAAGITPASAFESPAVLTAADARGAVGAVTPLPASGVDGTGRHAQLQSVARHVRMATPPSPAAAAASGLPRPPLTVSTGGALASAGGGYGGHPAGGGSAAETLTLPTRRPTAPSTFTPFGGETAARPTSTPASLAAFDQAPGGGGGALPQLGLHVLFADDERVNRALMGRMLARLGCSAVGVDDGDGVAPALAAAGMMTRAEAEAAGLPWRPLPAAVGGGGATPASHQPASTAAAAAAGAPRAFDALLLDVVMARSDGAEVAAALRRVPSLPAELPIVAATGNAAADRDRLVAAGFSSILAKPFTLSRLAALLMSAVATAAAARVEGSEAGQPGAGSELASARGGGPGGAAAGV